MRFKIMHVLPLFFLASACQTSHPQTIIQHVYCLTPDQYKALKDAEPGKIGGSLTGNAQKDFKLSVKQNVLVRAYADGLLDVLGGCVGSN